MPILDQFGRPVQKKELNSEIAAPSIFGIRHIWKNAVAGGLTPSALSGVLYSAINGDPKAYLQLAEEMEERDLHYRAVIGTRKNAIKGIRPVVTPASDSSEDKKIAEEVEAIVHSRKFRRAVGDIMDALGKGYSVTEIIWDTSGPKWLPSDYKWRQPYHFALDKDTESHLNLLTESAPIEGEPLAYGKFITHMPPLKSGVPIRGGIAYVAAWGFLFKSFAAKDWLAFAEVFGMPIRVGKYGRDANPEEIATLISAIRNIGTDAGAVIPQNMMIEFESAVEGAGGDRLYERICNYWDSQLSKVVLGQTMTTDNGSSLSQAEVHDEIRIDIKEGDANDLADSIQASLIEPYVFLNYGKEALRNPPTVEFPVPRGMDVNMIISAAEKLVPLGLRVSQKSIYEKLGIDPPDDDDELLEAQQPEPSVQPDIKTSLNDYQRGLNFAQAGAYGEEYNQDLIEESLSDWQEIRDPILLPILQALNASTTAEEFNQALTQLAQEIDSTVFAASLGQILFKARITGRA